MSNLKVLLCAAAFICGSAPAFAGDFEAQSAADSEYARHILTAQDRRQLMQNGQRIACGPTVPVAVSAYGTKLGSSGDPTIVSYPVPVTNIGGAWSSDNTFTAPCAGIYTFNVSFATDSYYACPVEIGTQDDVFVSFILSSFPLYNDTHRAGSYAWRGQLADDVKRGSASYTLQLELNKGDVIQTMVSSDGNKPRCLYLANFSAVREAKPPK